MNKPNGAELRAALRAKAPSEEERRAWARTALAMAGKRGSGGRAWRRAAVVAAAAGVLVAVAVLLRPAPSPTPKQAEPGDTGRAALEKERAANKAYLDKAGGVLAAAPKGHFAVIVGGDTIRVGPDLDELLVWADRGWPAARHRYVIRVDPEIPLGDVVCDTGPVPETGAGMGFLQVAGVKVGGEAGAWTVEHDGETITLEGGKPFLPVQVNGKTVRLELDRESLAPLLLPAESLSARFELPGETILEGLDREWRRYRRHLVKVRHEVLGIDGWYEAVAAPGEWVAVRLGGHVIRGLEPGREPEGPFFVLHYRVEDVDRLDELFGALDDLGPYEGYAVPGGAASKIALVHPRSGDAWSGQVLDLADADAAALRRFLAPGRIAERREPGPAALAALGWRPLEDAAAVRKTGKPFLVLRDLSAAGRRMPLEVLEAIRGKFGAPFPARFVAPAERIEEHDDLGREFKALVPGAAAGLEVHRGAERVAWMFLTETTTAEYVEAFLDQARVEMEPALEIGGHSWAGGTRFALERARRAEKPALVLVHRPGEAGRFAQLLRALPGLDRYVLLHREGEGDVLERHDPDGRVTGQALPADVPAEHLLKRVRAFLTE